MQRGKNRPYFKCQIICFTLTPSDGSGQERRNGQQLVLCQSAAQCPVQHCRRQIWVHSQTPGGGTCPSAPCQARPLYCTSIHRPTLSRPKPRRRYTVEHYRLMVWSSSHDIWAWKLFHRCPLTYMMNISVEFHWNVSTKYRDITWSNIDVSGADNGRMYILTSDECHWLATGDYMPPQPRPILGVRDSRELPEIKSRESRTPKIPGKNSREFLKLSRQLPGIYRSFVFFFQFLLLIMTF